MHDHVLSMVGIKESEQIVPFLCWDFYCRLSSMELIAVVFRELFS
jgi:hypothetical protein